MYTYTKLCVYVCVYAYPCAHACIFVNCFSHGSHIWQSSRIPTSNASRSATPSEANSPSSSCNTPPSPAPQPPAQSSSPLQISSPGSSTVDELMRMPAFSHWHTQECMQWSVHSHHDAWMLLCHMCMSQLGRVVESSCYLSAVVLLKVREMCRWCKLWYVCLDKNLLLFPVECIVGINILLPCQNVAFFSGYLLQQLCNLFSLRCRNGRGVLFFNLSRQKLHTIQIISDA